jgi:thiamine kinase
MLNTALSINNSLVDLGLIGPGAMWRVLNGGRTNRVWRIEDPAGILVCKLFSPTSNNPLYPNLPGAEYDTLKALHSKEIAPEPVALVNTPEGEVLVYRHLQGRVWSKDTQAVARLLARLHRQGNNVPLRNIASGSAALQAQTQSILADCIHNDFNIPRSIADLVVSAIERPCLIHTDVVANNLIQTPDGLRLIDWQCPGLGDPCEDLASFLSPAMHLLYGSTPLNPTQIEQFLTAYDNPLVVQRYIRLAPLFHLRSAAYCQWKIERGDLDYLPALKLEMLALEKACDQNHDAG